MSDVLSKLRVQLELQEWPNVYMYKFIVPNHPEKVEGVKQIFNDTALITLKSSKNGGFISITIEEVAIHVDMIIEKYQKASLINGIIAL